jgi:hypothetical protein
MRDSTPEGMLDYRGKNSLANFHLKLGEASIGLLLYFYRHVFTQKILS